MSGHSGPWPPPPHRPAREHPILEHSAQWELKPSPHTGSALHPLPLQPSPGHPLGLGSGAPVTGGGLQQLVSQGLQRPKQKLPSGHQITHCMGEPHTPGPFTVYHTHFTLLPTQDQHEDPSKWKMEAGRGPRDTPFLEQGSPVPTSSTLPASAPTQTLSRKPLLGLMPETRP